MAAATVSSPSSMLPSFVELMASLGLDSDDEQKHTRPATHFKGHRATASFSSVSSSSSSLSIPTPNTASSLMFPVPSSPTRSLDTDRRAVLNRKRSAARFSPYAPDIAHGHRTSFPGSYPHNPFAAADGANSAPSSPRSRTPSYGKGQESELSLPRISRTRRSPYPSPNSATFSFHNHNHQHQRSRTSASSSPEQLALPTLPPMPLPIVASANLSGTYDSNCLMALDDNHVTTSIAQRRRHVPQGLRISTFRSSAASGGLATSDGRRLLRHDPPIHTS